MKKCLLPALFLLLAPGFAGAQAISINTDASNPDPSAILDVKSNDKGVLVPRMGTAQRVAIAAPATGLLVFDTTTGSFWFYNGTAWANLSAPKQVSDADNDTKIQVEKTPDEDMIRFDLGGTEKMTLRQNAHGTARLELPDAAGNTIIGQEAGAGNYPSLNQHNTFVGFQSGKTNGNGQYNTYLGSQAGTSNIGGDNNTAIGMKALFSNETGDYNTATGTEALSGSNGGSFNVANGYRALNSNMDGSNNTALGFEALFNNSTNYNTAVGSQALFNNTTGFNNTSVGVSTLWSNTTGNTNSAHGAGALFSNTTGSDNTACGHNALNTNLTGLQNTAVGNNALSANTLGNYNSALGHNAYFTANNLDNTTCIGLNSGGIGNVSNRIEIGNTSVSWIGGQVNWSTYSDARIKTRVQENVPGLAFVTRLRPVTYHLDIHKQNELCLRGKPEEAARPSKYDLEQQQLTGFIAQEVEQAARAAGYDFSGVEKAADEVGLYSVRYSDFVAPLVKAVQEQQAEIEALRVEIEKLNIHAGENGALKAQLETQAVLLQKITAALQTAGIGVEH